MSALQIYLSIVTPDGFPFLQECCICLCRYEDAVAIQAIRCTHHFHTSCIVKWPKVEALCPVCKYDIHKGKDHE
ncbi:E3 ubiquitin ligase RIE1 [Olea europaea subsp. europaea]|uniref:RING-type E3 ubiquitin transferase n=1 Tax=Olea europaea subsp. europaea TaxID=158383 RepID=A0A8S0V6H2_OLEEU|nr:E3 ubiquitin ligase RIE1 [Olea europaea subsp. europaea]